MQSKNPLWKTRKEELLTVPLKDIKANPLKNLVYSSYMAQCYMYKQVS